MPSSWRRCATGSRSCRWSSCSRGSVPRAYFRCLEFAGRGGVALRPISLVPLQPEPVGGAAAHWRRLTWLSVALTELEVLRIQYPDGERGLAPLQPLGPDDVGHDCRLDPDVRRHAGKEMDRGAAEPGFPRPLVSAAGSLHEVMSLMD